MQSSDRPADMDAEEAPERRDDLNDSDLRYLRGALPALRDAHRASNVAEAGATDPAVRALAHLSRITQADAIRSMESLLLVGGFRAGGPVRSEVPPPQERSAGAADDPSLLDGVEVDIRFIAILTAHGEASLSRARTEMLEGFSEPCRRLAETESRAHWGELAAIGVLTAAHG